MGVKEIRPVGTVENVFKLNKQLKDSVLIRECHVKILLFDFMIL